jgi:predicted DNA-binding protein
MTKTKMIRFRATQEEEKRLNALAQLTGANQSEVMRRLIATAQVVSRPSVEAGQLDQVRK